MARMHLTPQRKNSLRLKDGRRLAWYEWGPVTGHPVLFCTGAGMSGSLGFGAAQLDSLHLKLLSIDRPGLGDSDPHPGKTLLSWCDDVAELLENQKIEAPLCVGFSQGAPFAFALASRGMVKALAIVSGQDDFNDPGVASLLPPQVAGFVQLVQSRDAKFLDEFARTANADGFFHLIVSMSSEKDRSLYDSEPFKSAYLRCLKEGFRLGPSGYIQDFLNVMAPWPFDVRRINVPVDFWYGEQDTNATHSPNFGATLSKKLPNHTYTLFKEEGGSLLWTRAEEILRKLATKLGSCSSHRG